MLAGKFANYTHANKKYIKQIKELEGENNQLREKNERLEKALSERLNFLLEKI